MIAEMSKVLAIKPNVVDEIEKWVLEGIEWSKRGEKLLELEV